MTFTVDAIDKLLKLPLTGFDSASQPKATSFSSWLNGRLIEDAVVTKLAVERGYGPEDINYREYLRDEGVVILNDEDLDEPPDELIDLHKTQGLIRRCRELQLHVFPHLSRVYDSKKREFSFAVSSMSNYEAGTERYFREDRHKLVEEFKFEGASKWYLDYNKWHWQ